MSTLWDASAVFRSEHLVGLHLITSHVTLHMLHYTCYITHVTLAISYAESGCHSGRSPVQGMRTFHSCGFRQLVLLRIASSVFIKAGQH
jgi:hypothetical protein